jgi:hypothetical protein
MAIYIDYGCGHVFHFCRNVQLQEFWAYVSGGPGHASRHESVWIVPGMAE